VDPNCDFCRTAGRDMVPESFNHLFIECETTEFLWIKMIEKYFPEYINLNETKLRIALFLGIIDGKYIGLNHVASLLFCYAIWKCKMRKFIPSFVTVDSLIKEQLMAIYITGFKIPQTDREFSYLCRNSPRLFHG
jgi:hypothetical protein